MTTWTDCLSDSLDGLPDKDRQSAKTRDNRASGRYAPPSCSPEDGNHYDQDASISTDNPQPEGLTGPSHGGSVASLEARESQARQSRQRTGGSSVRGMAKVAQPPVRSRAKKGRQHLRRRRHPRGRGRKHHRLQSPVIRQEGRPPSETTATRTTSSAVRAVD